MQGPSMSFYIPCCMQPEILVLQASTLYITFALFRCKHYPPSCLQTERNRMSTFIHIKLTQLEGLWNAWDIFTGLDPRLLHVPKWRLHQRKRGRHCWAYFIILHRVSKAKVRTFLFTFVCIACILYNLCISVIVMLEIMICIKHINYNKHRKHCIPINLIMH